MAQLQRLLKKVRQHKKNAGLLKHRFQWQQTAKSLAIKRRQAEAKLHNTMMCLSQSEDSDISQAMKYHLLEQDLARKELTDLSLEVLRIARSANGTLASNTKLPLEIERTHSSIQKRSTLLTRATRSAPSKRCSETPQEIHRCRQKICQLTTTPCSQLAVEEKQLSAELKLISSLYKKRPDQPEFDLNMTGLSPYCQQILDKYEDNFSRIQQLYEAELIEIDGEYTVSGPNTYEHSLISTGAVDISYNNRYGGWSQSEHARFLHILWMYSQKASTKSLLGERLRMEFSHLSKACIDQHLLWYTQKQAKKLRKNDCAAVWHRELNNTICMAKEAIDAASVQEVIHARQAIEQHQLNSRRILLHSELDRLNSEKDIRLKQQHQSALQEQRLKALFEEGQRKQMECRQASLKAACTKYKAHKQKESRLQAEHEMLDLAMAAKQKMKQAKIDRVRVSYREAERQAALLAKQQRELQLCFDKQEQKDRLEALARTVAPQISADPARVAQATKASSQRQEAPEGNKPLFSVHGYDMSDLMADQKFKVALALSKAGLSNSTYAKEALSRVSTNKSYRPDMMTTYEISNQ